MYDLILSAAADEQVDLFEVQNEVRPVKLSSRTFKQRHFAVRVKHSGVKQQGLPRDKWSSVLSNLSAAVQWFDWATQKLRSSRRGAL